MTATQEPYKCGKCGNFIFEVYTAPDSPSWTMDPRGNRVSVKCNNCKHCAVESDVTTAFAAIARKQHEDGNR